MMDLETSFKTHLTAHQWTGHSKPFLLAVSGGIDSMVMADLFLKSGQKFGVAHCNYQLRGADADMDEALVTDWCNKHGVKFYINRFDTESIAKEWKKGIQETARKLRYDWFSELLKAHGYKFVATAHHAGDSVETLLINLFKGTGINGLQGIPRQNGNIIRPLLFATRDVIKSYAEAHAIPYREDASNASDKYLRNAVRHQLIPKIESYFPSASKKLYDSIQRFEEAGILYRQAVEARLKKLVDRRGKDFYVPVRKLEKAVPLNTLCYELFKPFGFAKEHTTLLIDLMRAESGKYLLSATHKVIKDRDHLIITALVAKETNLLVVDTFPTTLDVGNATFHFSIVKRPEVIPSSPQVAYIDRSMLTMPLLLRRWKQGDYFYPLGMNKKKKKLSRFFIDQKLPLHEKEQVWVLESNKKIVWVTGLRLDDRFKLTDRTEEVLKIEMRPY